MTKKNILILGIVFVLLLAGIAVNAYSTSNKTIKLTQDPNSSSVYTLTSTCDAKFTAWECLWANDNVTYQVAAGAQVGTYYYATNDDVRIKGQNYGNIWANGSIARSDGTVGQTKLVVWLEDNVDATDYWTFSSRIQKNYLFGGENSKCGLTSGHYDIDNGVKKDFVYATMITTQLPY